MLVVEDIKKSFNHKEVVRGVSFQVNKGEAFGLLGPNGAGKSTTISMICGLLSYDAGEITVGGSSVKKNTMDVKKKIGVVPQEIALYPTMSAKDNLLFWGKMYGLSGSQAKKRAEEVLEYVGLSERAKDKIETFSGGMKRRINIGAALMHDPELLIMDEPTVGIDPQSRNHILETVKKLNENGMTVIYTSHYMEEVEYLCNRIGIVDQGKMIALGTKSDLCNRLAGGTVIKMIVNHLNEEFVTCIKEMEHVERIVTDTEALSLDIFVSSHQLVVGEIMACAVKHHVHVQSFEVKEPNLESLFLSLTGRSLRD
ncbi:MULTISPECIES: ABC transporter ATP-binding protein [unclassified Bacillus (in: firmicutes)]|uniref:ABC transporter ATP-binding protein n=1 Tax=unclassified Bacillus (in: firmicutes) TaxID=185979 RepID=UPI0008ECEC99|nr:MULTISPECIES: ABC transporter ATP-binding protein [unclassified Bacillus (in: firmicutes)]SFB09597.1 ABC-2 type transport system ATP-binding protein [Bacillus sp. UNCCL13]SFQ86643.1 ABC-2 type transport system ATP-binding protein [Bacillus sp. cl95]